MSHFALGMFRLISNGKGAGKSSFDFWASFRAIITTATADMDGEHSLSGRSCPFPPLTEMKWEGFEP